MKIQELIEGDVIPFPKRHRNDPINAEIAKLEAQWVEVNNRFRRLKYADDASDQEAPVVDEILQALTAEMLRIEAKMRELRSH